MNARKLQAAQGTCVYSGIVIWTCVSPYTRVMNYVLETGTNWAYPLLRPNCLNPEAFISFRMCEKKAGICGFPIGTVVDFEKEVTSDGAIIIKTIRHGSRTCGFSSIRMLRGFNEHIDEVFVFLLNLTAPVPKNLRSCIPPGVPFIGSLSFDIRFAKVPTECPCFVKLAYFRQFTLEDIKWSLLRKYGWDVRDLSRCWDVMMDFTKTPGFLKTEKKFGEVKTLLYVGGGRLFDVDNPSAPVVLFQIRINIKDKLPGTMVKCEMFESLTCPVKFGLSKLRVRRRAKSTYSQFGQHAKTFLENFSSYKRVCGSADECTKTANKVPVILFLNANQRQVEDPIEDLSWVKLLEEFSEFEANVALPEGFKIELLHQFSSLVMEPSGLVSHKTNYINLLKEIDMVWGRLDVIVLINEEAPRGMDTHDFLRRNVYDPLYGIMDAYTASAFKPIDKTQVLHINMQADTTAIHKQVRTFRMQCLKVIPYTYVSNDDLMDRHLPSKYDPISTKLARFINRFLNEAVNLQTT